MGLFFFPSLDTDKSMYVAKGRETTPSPITYEEQVQAEMDVLDEVLNEDEVSPGY